MRFFFFGRRHIDKELREQAAKEWCIQDVVSAYLEFGEFFGLFLGYVISTPVNQSPKYHVYVGVLYSLLHSWADYLYVL